MIIVFSVSSNLLCFGVFFTATSCEHVEVVRALLKNNADCTLCDNNGDLPETESEEIKALLQQNS